MSKNEVTDKMGQDKPQSKTDLASDSRRRLLKLGAYVPPAIIGMAIISSMPGGVHASGDDKKDGGDDGGANMSCNPNACNPCVVDKPKNSDRRDCRIAQKKRMAKK